MDYLRILGVSQLFMSLEITTAGAFSGYGKTVPPSVISIVFTALRIPLALILVRQPDHGPKVRVDGAALPLGRQWFQQDVSHDDGGALPCAAAHGSAEEPEAWGQTSAFPDWQPGSVRSSR